MIRRPFVAALSLVVLAALPIVVHAQALPALPDTSEPVVLNGWGEQVGSLRLAVIRLPLATGLAALLAFRRRRPGTPERQMTVVQTQIILAIVGAVVMLVVGSSLARAFGIVGAAGLIRYRAKVDDPKDAGVMLATLVLGLASGVGLYLIAAFSTAFVMAVLWVVESMEPEPAARFDLSIAAKELSAERRGQVEQVLRRFKIRFELRETTADTLSYEVIVPLKRDTDTITAALSKIDPAEALEVKWDKKKDK